MSTRIHQDLTAVVLKMLGYTAKLAAPIRAECQAVDRFHYNLRGFLKMNREVFFLLWYSTSFPDHDWRREFFVIDRLATRGGDRYLAMRVVDRRVELRDPFGSGGMEHSEIEICASKEAKHTRRPKEQNQSVQHGPTASRPPLASTV